MLAGGIPWFDTGYQVPFPFVDEGDGKIPFTVAAERIDLPEGRQLNTDGSIAQTF